MISSGVLGLSKLVQTDGHNQPGSERADHTASAQTDGHNQPGSGVSRSTAASQTSQQDTPTRRIRVRRRASSGAKTTTRRTDSREGVADGRRGAAYVLGGLSPPLVRVPPKRLREVENELVHGAELRGAGPSSPSSSSSSSSSSAGSQLMCQGGEIGGPPSGPNLSFLPQIDKWLVVALEAADSYYRQKKYGVAASRLTAALELCSKGVVLEDQLSADHEDICRVVSSVEARLAVCYLKLRRPELALSHAHRSIQLDPARFQNHLRQAAAYRLLGEPGSAARSAMIADWLYCLSGGSERHISSLIKLYWQALSEEAITAAEGVAVMYSPAPCSGEAPGDVIVKVEEAFKIQHPAFTEYLYTDPSGGHLLPQTSELRTPGCSAPSRRPPQTYLLTLGFRRRDEGAFLEKLGSGAWPSAFTGQRGCPLGPWRPEDMETTCDTLRRTVLPILDLIGSTKPAAGFSAGSGVTERLQYGHLLGRLRRGREQSAILRRALAELAVAPYLQDVTPKDAVLLQALMADTADTLDGRRSDKERVWNEMLKVGQLEGLVRQLEEAYLRTKALRADRKRRALAASDRKCARRGGAAAAAADENPMGPSRPEDPPTDDAPPTKKPCVEAPPAEAPANQGPPLAPPPAGQEGASAEPSSEPDPDGQAPTEPPRTQDPDRHHRTF